MLTDGLQFLGSSTADNFTIESGSLLPASGNNLGELFYLTTAPIGLHIYDGSAWKLVDAGSGSVTSVSINTVNGISGVVGTPTTTPAISLTLGNITPTSVTGIGTGLTALNASNLASGTVGTARLGTGTASASTYLRGDNTWATVSGGANGVAITPTSVIIGTNSQGTTPSASKPVLTVIGGGAGVAGDSQFRLEAVEGVYYDIGRNNGTGILVFRGNQSSYVGYDFQNAAGATMLKMQTDSNVVPGTNNTQTLGTSGLKWSNVFATTFTGNATSATNIAGGAAGSLAIQTGAGTTSFIAGGTSGYVLTSTGPAATPTWQAVSAGTAAASTLTGSVLASNVVTSSLTSVGTLGSLTVTGLVAAGSLSGTGAAITNMNASNFASGTVPTARLGSGTASATTYLRGDGSWATPAGSSTADASTLTGTTLATNVVTSSLTSHGTLIDFLQTGGNHQINTKAGVTTTANGGYIFLTTGNGGTTSSAGVITLTGGNSGNGAGSTGGHINLYAGNASAPGTAGQYTVGGNIIGKAGTSYNGNSGYVQFEGATASGSSTAHGGGLNLYTGAGVASGNGGIFTWTTGNSGDAGGTSGHINITVGTALVNAAAAGNLKLQGGQNNGTGVGGPIYIYAGASTSGTGGNIDIRAGTGTTGGTIYFYTAAAGSVSERLRITPTGAFGIGGTNYGTTGQVLTSAGSGGVPTWSTPAALTTQNTFTKSQAVAPVVLTDGATIAVDASLSNHFRVILGGARTLANPTNLVSGQILNFIIVQDATGGRTLSYGSMYKWAGGVIPSLTATANAIDVISAFYDGTLGVLLCTVNKGFA